MIGGTRRFAGYGLLLALAAVFSLMGSAADERGLAAPEVGLVTAKFSQASDRHAHGAALPASVAGFLLATPSEGSPPRLMLRIQGLRVANRGSATEVAAELRLGTEVVNAGDGRGTLHIDARLISVADGVPLWQESYRGSLDDLPALRRELCRVLNEAMHVTLPAADGQII